MFTFGEITLTFEEVTFTFGEIRLTLGEKRFSSRGFSRFSGSGNYFLLLGGGVGTLWVGGSCGGFQKEVLFS